MMRSAMDRLVLYCDPISPYVYFCVNALPAVAAKHNLPIDVQPVLFAGLLNASGAKGPAEIPLKRRYIFLDCVRIGKELNLPFKMPPKHPYNPLRALRAITSVENPEQRFALTKTLVNACWAEGRDLTDESVISKAAADCGLDPASVLERAGSEECKQRIRTTTDTALAQGIFGVPTVVAGTEMFWGNDRLHHLDLYLSGKLDVDHEALDKMLDIPRGADRKNV